ncbi:amidohydrolase [Allomuricauda ruestringensis DSM 13258]|uniref:Amidohydrolase n=1 Tax=Allomuricauda ruestringensis (strain DSM 13258 / CIP 107369 / LMG 19739 / B1) TaxID=886377 RepID=G2PIE2_ALLRU|nr:amidohydrolase family protein [Allomuricauda ruestringensis]AEM71760.1 amidohydrolase [Allomuricauda ruestringensis DSM 13258]
MKKLKFYILILAVALAQGAMYGQIEKAPKRTDGEGPWSQLIIRGATMINGTLAPPQGPVDIVVENNKIVDVRVVGYPGVPIDPKRRPVLKPGGKELNAEGMYIMPGFVDTHAHIGGMAQGTSAEYVFKLWMGHGITTIADPASGNGIEWTLEHKKKSKNNEITAPRIKAYTAFGSKLNGEMGREDIATPEQAIDWVRANAKKGADGIKFFGAPPKVMEAALVENKKLGLRSKMHHSQTYVGQWNVLHSARAGLTAMEHWYGLPEALFDDRTVQDYSLDYNYQNEQDRFGEAGQLWTQAAKPYSDKWNAVMEELLDLDFTLSPTMVIYEANRDLARARRAEWHEEYTLPSLWEFYSPSRQSHGSYWHYWGTEREIDWKANYKLWMTFINEYKNRGGRVTVGTDAGFIYELYGFAYPREMELLREAGFHPLEVIRAATLNGAESLGMDDEIGTIAIGKLADFVIMEENPLVNLKSLYGTGAIKLMEDNTIERVGGVKYTIKDGIIYDAKQLLKDVKEMVDKEKEAKNYKILQPGIKG